MKLGYLKLLTYGVVAVGVARLVIYRLLPRDSSYDEFLTFFNSAERFTVTDFARRVYDRTEGRCRVHSQTTYREFALRVKQGRLSEEIDPPVEGSVSISRRHYRVVDRK